MKAKESEGGEYKNTTCNNAPVIDSKIDHESSVSLPYEELFSVSDPKR